jgi:hypothetical protein
MRHENGVEALAGAERIGLGMVEERLRFLERIADLFEAGFTVLNCEVKGQVKQDNWQALACFLYGYAYERQGRSPSYAPAARDAILTLASQGASWDEKHLAQRAWELYKGQLGSGLAEKTNPMCPKDTPYEGGKKTTQPSAVEFVQEHLACVDYNIVRWAEKVLKDDKTREGHALLKSINGVADKIASLFLRDVALAYEITPSQSRELLQPIDVWVRRFVHPWAKDKDKRLDNAQYAAWVVEKSREAGVLPEKVNAGMWYFGSRIAGSEYTLRKSLKDLASMEEETGKYVSRMAAQVTAWQRLAR